MFSDRVLIHCICICWDASLTINICISWDVCICWDASLTINLNIFAKPNPVLYISQQSLCYTYFIIRRFYIVRGTSRNFYVSGGLLGNILVQIVSRQKIFKLCTVFSLFVCEVVAIFWRFIFGIVDLFYIFSLWCICACFVGSFR
ncbi:uncharacterized protein LOC113471499 [Diaphorina citri]|uniref:Uncharacterized protein LOC113471499 n=1 Tax=Diaphorina citri TaxID=121845 RepID=A0A3Q0JHC5_DIACI|nr:uncharacterized protein LOC113471499 [Diaphorina citri]